MSSSTRRRVAAQAVGEACRPAATSRQSHPARAPSAVVVAARSSMCLVEAEPRPAVGTEDRAGLAHINVDVRAVLRWGSWSMARVVEAYQAMGGVSVGVSVTFVAEIGDLRRFDNPRQLEH